MRTKQIIWIFFALILGAGIFWWTTVKNHVIKKAVTDVVRKKTDSLYRITYDTATFDELSGNAYLYNVKVTLDSLEWLKLVQKDSMPPVTIDLKIGKITIQGLKELKLLNNRSLDVSAVILDNPVFRLERWARKTPPAGKLNDTLELYQRLIGQFDFLRAKSIQVHNGNFKLINFMQKDSISASGINISVDDFLVDSAHDYRNIISYFIKQTRATLTTFNGPKFYTGAVLYDSKQQLLEVQNFSVNDKRNPTNVRSIKVAGFSVGDYIYKNEINAKQVSILEPRITVPPADPHHATAVLPAGFIDSLVIKNGNLAVRSNGKAPVVILNADVLFKNVTTRKGVLQIGKILNKNDFRFSIGSIRMPMGIHQVTLNRLNYPGNADILSIQSLQVRPVISRQQLKTKIRKQTDLYTISARNIMLDRFDLKKILKDTVSIASVNLQIDIHVFDDKTIPVDSVKMGRGFFPYDNIRLSKTAINIGTLYASNSSIVYEEQAPKSQLNGFVKFSNVIAKVTNITNMHSLIAKDNMIHAEARARVMGEAPLVSNWTFPLDRTDGSFRVTGKVGAFHIPILNPAFEPLSMSSIRSGNTEELGFEINGDHQGSTGTVLFKYQDLKIDLLRKNDQDSLEKKGVLSFLANADIRNKNLSDKPREYKVKKERYKSFFNLLWHSIFAGAKETILIVK